MALYWPEARTALFIVDDPYRDKIEDDNQCEMTLVRLPPDCSLGRYAEITSSLSWLLGENDPEEADPGRWDRRLRTRELLHLNDMSAFERLT